MSEHDQPIKLELESAPMGQAVPIAGAEPPSARARLWWVRSLLHHRKALLGGLILLFFTLIALTAEIIAPGDPTAFVARPHQPPSREYLLGTNGQGQDVLKQLIHGSRISLGIGVATGLVTTIIGVVIGLTAGYFGGRIDDVLSLMINIVLIIPSLPLLVTLAAFLPPGPLTILLVLSLTGWAWAARVMRSQALSLREKDFVAAALISGESSARIIFREILPNMTSLVAANFIGATIYAIGAEAALEFLGLGNVSLVSWGTILFWAQNNAGLLVGAWWTFVPAGLCIALVAFGFAMLNYAVDEITNPRLRAEKEINHALKKHALRAERATPVVRNRSLDSAGRS